MKFSIPEISWHNRDPVLSVDLQPKSEPNDPLRLATGGTDSHVLIWYISVSDKGSVNLEVAADLARHQKAVNVVRWSPNGQYLASGDDESIIFVWKQKTEEPGIAIEGEEQYKETWVIHKTLRGHMEDVLDISWNSSSTQLASGSVDNKLLVWDVERGRYSAVVANHKGFVQGVTWDPKGQLIASASTDRVFRTFDVATKKVVSRSSKAVLPFPKENPLHNVRVRLYHDDTLQTYYRRLEFSPDGLLIAVPGGKIEAEQGKLELKPINAVYIYTRYSLKVPACVLPCAEPALAVRWSPRRYAARRPGPRCALAAPARLLLGVATRRSLLLYDTQQRTPLALISDMHYTRLTDLTWSPDGRILVASSTDGFCSVVSFAEGELGETPPDDAVGPRAEPTEDGEDRRAAGEVADDARETETTKRTDDGAATEMDPFVGFKTPGESEARRSPKRTEIDDPRRKTPVKLDVLVETAMQSWSDSSSCDAVRPRDEPPAADDSGDIELVYEETVTASDAGSPNDKRDKPSQDPKLSPKTSGAEGSSPEGISPEGRGPPVSEPGESSFLERAKVIDVKDAAVAKATPSPRAPRRVSFVTLSSPKSSKKKH